MTHDVPSFCRLDLKGLSIRLIGKPATVERFCSRMGVDYRALRKYPVRTQPGFVRVYIGRIEG